MQTKKIHLQCYKDLINQKTIRPVYSHYKLNIVKPKEIDFTQLYSSPRKSLVKGERFMRYEGKFEILKQFLPEIYSCRKN